MRQIRSSVRNVIGFPASTFCQYLTEYPCESMSSWLSPASSRKRLIRAPKPLKNWDSSRMIPFSKLHGLKRPRPIQDVVYLVPELLHGQPEADKT
jgi:hypothetical protein